MTKTQRRISIGAVLFVVLLAILFVAGRAVLDSGWLRDRIRLAIIERAETATGGHVEIGKFDFNLGTLTATVENFVVHGKEPVGVAPLLVVRRVTVRLKVIQLLMKRDIRLAGIDVEAAAAHVIVARDGSTNLPAPKISSNKNTIEEILNLKIAKFNASQGTVFVESADGTASRSPWNAKGENFGAQIVYDPKNVRYEGDVSLAPLHAVWGSYGPLDIAFKAHASLEKTRVQISKAIVDAAGSHVEFTNALIDGLPAPVVTTSFTATVSALDAGRLLHIAAAPAGSVVITKGHARYRNPSDFQYSGRFESAAIAWQGIRNARVAGLFDGTDSKIKLNEIRVAALGGNATANIEIAGWTNFKGEGTVSGLSVKSVSALRTAKVLPYDGVVAGTWSADGRLLDIPSGRFVGAVDLAVSPAGTGPPVKGQITAAFHQNEIDLGQSWLQLPATRVDLTGTLGRQLTVKLSTRDLNDFLPVLSGTALPITLNSGSASFDGTVTGPLDNPRAQGKVVAQNVVYQKYEIGAVSASVDALKNGIAIEGATGNVSGLAFRAQGHIGMSEWAVVDSSAIDITAAVDNASTPKLLELAAVSVPLTGTLTATAHITGTVGAPHATANYTLRQGVLYGQPFDSATGAAEYLNRTSQTATAVVALRDNRVNVSAKMSVGGMVALDVRSNAIPLNQIVVVKQRQPDLGGTLQLQGQAQLRTTPRVELVSVDGEATVRGIQLEDRALGDATFTAKTENSTMALQFKSNAAGAAINGSASVQLAGDYQSTGTLTFTNAGLHAIALLATKPEDAKNLNFDGAAQGSIRFSGPLNNLENLNAQMEIAQVEIHPLPGAPFAGGLTPGYAIRNAEPVRLSVSKFEIRVESAHLTGPNTDFRIDGTAPLKAGAPMNIGVNGTLDLAMARTGDLTPAGTLAVNGRLRGWSDFSGRATLKNGALHYADISNAITNAQGEIVFNGNRANIQSFRAETGGGTLQASGYAAVAGDIVTFQITVDASDVRVRYPEGVSSVSDSHLILAGTSRRSQAQGTISVRRLVVNPSEDASSILASVAAPVKTPTASTGLLSALNLDVSIQTAPDIALQSSVAKSIQVEARNLRLTGTATNPSLQGRVDITQGEVLFYGNKYTVSQGAISFFNPVKIEPVLNIDLETRARGVDVILTVTGPASKLNLSYRSDPPFEFSEIVALLATGRSPDSSIVSRAAPTDPSSLIGQAIANPAASYLQRFFGVSRLKIDPQFTGSTGARLTIEQQISPDILFTYVTDVAHTSTQLIRVEWDFNPNWSAILVREENGYVGLDFAYRKRIK